MTPQWTRRRLLAATGTVGAAAVAGCLESSDVGSSTLEESIAVGTVQQYNAPGCSCCGNYASYLRENVDGEVTVTEAEDLDAVKREHGIPHDLRSCHTLVVEEYVVEGHVPAEAIATLVAEQPSIDGIALPGMPAGSPGMPGEADGDLVVSEIDGGQPGEEFGRF